MSRSHDPQDLAWIIHERRAARRLCRSALRKGSAFPGARPNRLPARREAEPRGVRDGDKQLAKRKAVGFPRSGAAKPLGILSLHE